MKKNKLILILIICMFISNLKVYAASATLSVSSQSVSVGDKFTVYVKMNSAAAWNIHALATGSVGKCEIKQADTTADALDTSKTFSTICTALEEGTINIVLSGDVTSASDGIAVNVSESVSIKVNKKVTNNNTNNNTNQDVNKKSDNNKLKELSIENHEIKKIDNNNYELVVDKRVDSVNIKAKLEDSKAKISGIGVHELSLGENKIELVVTSESGKKNTINIKIIRKESYYLNDLSNLLDDSKMEKIDIIVSENDKLSLDIIENIKKSKKIVNFDYYDESKRLIYTWELDGNKIGDSSELDLNVSFDSDGEDKILELSNYADGIIVNFSDNNNLITGVKFKVYVGDKYKNNDQLNMYRYISNENELSLIDDNLIVNDGYIEFEINKNSDYFVTMAKSNNVSDTKCEKCNSSILFIIISIIELIVILLLIILILKLRNNKKNKIVNSDENINNDMYNIYDNNINNQSDINNISNSGINSENSINTNLNNITDMSVNNVNASSNNMVGIQNSNNIVNNQSYNINNVPNNIVNIPNNNINNVSGNGFNSYNGNVNNVSNTNLNINSNGIINNQNNNNMF